MDEIYGKRSDVTLSYEQEHLIGDVVMHMRAGVRGEAAYQKELDRFSDEKHKDSGYEAGSIASGVRDMLRQSRIKLFAERAKDAAYADSIESDRNNNSLSVRAKGVYADRDADNKKISLKIPFEMGRSKKFATGIDPLKDTDLSFVDEHYIEMKCDASDDGLKWQLDPDSVRVGDVGKGKVSAHTILFDKRKYMSGVRCNEHISKLTELCDDICSNIYDRDYGKPLEQDVMQKGSIIDKFAGKARALFAGNDRGLNFVGSSKTMSETDRIKYRQTINISRDVDYSFG